MLVEPRGGSLCLRRDELRDQKTAGGGAFRHSWDTLSALAVEGCRGQGRRLEHPDVPECRNGSSEACADGLPTRRDQHQERGIGASAHRGLVLVQYLYRRKVDVACERALSVWHHMIHKCRVWRDGKHSLHDSEGGIDVCIRFDKDASVTLHFVLTDVELGPPPRPPFGVTIVAGQGENVSFVLVIDAVASGVPFVEAMATERWEVLVDGFEARRRQIVVGIG